MRHALVDKQGNFGSIAGLPAGGHAIYRGPDVAHRRADARRPEARHGRLRAHLRRAPHRADRAAVEVSRTCWSTGPTGIAVGMATSIPPHNLGEVCDALIRVIDEPDVSIDELLEIVPGPDFPTGGIICGRSGIRRGYHTGRSTVVVRARAAIEEVRQEPQPDRRHRDPLPAGPRPGRGADRRAGQRRQDHRHLGHPQRERPEGAGAAGARAEARRRSRRRAQPALPVLAAARHVSRSSSWRWSTASRGCCRSRSCWRSSSGTASTVIRRRTQFLLARARQRKHTVEGLLLAHANIDEVIRVIRSSTTQAEAKERLMEIDCPAAHAATGAGRGGLRRLRRPSAARRRTTRSRRSRPTPSCG